MVGRAGVGGLSRQGQRDPKGHMQSQNTRLGAGTFTCRCRRTPEGHLSV